MRDAVSQMPPVIDVPAKFQADGHYPIRWEKKTCTDAACGCDSGVHYEHTGRCLVSDDHLVGIEAGLSTGVPYPSDLLLAITWELMERRVREREAKGGV